MAQPITKFISVLYNDCDLVHSDLSEYNILVRDNSKNDIVVIDVGQAVLLEHPMSMEFFKRDIENITNYFRRYGLKEDPQKVIDKIIDKTGIT